MDILKANHGRLKHIYRPPFGYDTTEDGHLLPIEDDLVQLQEVKELLDIKALSIRNGALWLSDMCSRTISHEGLRKRLRNPVRLEETLDDAE